MLTTLTTGRAAAILGTTEPRLAELVRRGRIHPQPNVIAGRRLWSREHVLQAARYLELDLDEVARAYEQAAHDAGAVRA